MKKYVRCGQASLPADYLNILDEKLGDFKHFLEAGLGSPDDYDENFSIDQTDETASLYKKIKSHVDEIYDLLEI